MSTKFAGLLLLTIILEITATTSLKLSEGFTRLVPSAMVVLGYSASFYLFSLGLRQGMPLGISYAIWSGLGTVGAVLIGVWLFREHLNMTSVIGIVLIVSGVVLVNLKNAG